MTNDMTIYRAFLQTRYSSEALLTAHAIQSESGRASNHYRESAVEHLVSAADLLGFDLVKREAVKIEEAA